MCRSKREVLLFECTCIYLPPIMGLTN